MNAAESFPWQVPAEIADAPDEAAGGFRYDAPSFYSGEVPVVMLACSPHAKGGGVATSIRAVLGAIAPAGDAIRWDEYVGLDLEKEFSRAQQKAFLNAFFPGFVGSEDHRAGRSVDLASLVGRYALVLVKKDLDTYGDRPPRHRPRVVKWLRALDGPAEIVLENVKAHEVEIPQQRTGVARPPAPGARPPRAAPVAGAPPAAPPTPAGARPPAVPARPAPPSARPPAPAQQTPMYAPPPGRSAEDGDLPY